MKSLTFTILFTLLSSLLFSQTKLWITIEDRQELNNLKSNEFISFIDLALPASQNVELQKVYEVHTSNLLSFMREVKTNNNLHTPELIEGFQPLYTPNDYSLTFNNDYALELINAKEAWDITIGNPLIELGILDTGYDTLHEELTGKFNHISTMTSGASLVHGTAVAITAAGNTNNNSGKSSIGFNSSLSLYNMSYNEMLVATYSGVRVINISWASGCSANPYYQSVIDEVYNNGTVIIAAAGNGATCGGPENLVYPASFDNVISVTSIDANDQHQPVPNDPNSTHQHNDKVDLSAPGYNVALSINNNQYMTGNGTSFAAPYVTGTVGLMLSVNPCLTPAEVEYILKQTTDDISSNNQSFIGRIGVGRLNASAAVQMAQETHPIKITVNDNTHSCESVPGVFISLDSGNIANHTIQWSDGSHDWNRYNLAGGQYSYMITNTNGCMLFDTISVSSQGPFFDYANSIFVSSNNQTIEDQNNDGIIRVKGTVIIEAGIEYSLNDKSIEFASNSDLNSSMNLPNSGIVVSPKAKLLISNTTFTAVNECNSLWGGIEVLSNQINEQGDLVMNSCEISNASIGVSTVAKNNIGQEFNFGGKVSISNSLFKNNITSVNVEAGNRNSSSALIMNSDFINMNIPNAVHINAKNIDLTVDDCYFQGASSLVPQMRGTGIVLNNANLRKSEAKPLESSDQDIFNGLTMGINVRNHEGNTLRIKDFTFISNQTATLIENSHNVVFDHNEIILSGGTYSNPIVGVKQNGNSSALIGDNLFKGSGASIFSTGIILEGQTGQSNSIRNNKFEGELGTAITFKGYNRMKYLSCNDFNISGSSDIELEATNTPEGELVILNDLLLNDFSSCDSVSTNMEMTESALFTYGDALEYMPSCTTGNIISNSFNINVDRQEQCKFKYELIAEEENDDLKESLGITTDSKSKNLVYPNPNNGRFSLNLTDNINKVYIYSSTGHLVKKINIIELNSKQVLNVASGLYTVVFRSNNGESQQQKMIIQ
jgi:hypothetical protein